MCIENECHMCCVYFRSWYTSPLAFKCVSKHEHVYHKLCDWQKIHNFKNVMLTSSHIVFKTWGFVQTAYITSHNGWNYATLNASDKRNTHTKTNASWWAWPELSREGQGQVFPNMTSFRGRFYQCSQLHSGLINKCLTSSCLMSSPASSSLWQAQ